MRDKEILSRKDFLTRVGLGALALGGIVGSPLGSCAGEVEPPQPDRPDEQPTLPYLFHEVGRFDSPSARIRDVSIASLGKVLIADEEGLKTLQSNGKLLSTIPTASPVQSVAADPEGFLYAALRREVLRFDPSGKQVDSWTRRGQSEEEFSFITSLSLLENTVFIADAGNRCVCRFASDGDYIDEIEGFHIPSAYFDCAVDSKGVLHVAHTSEHRVECYDPNGERVGQWGKYGGKQEDFCGCCNPTNIALAPGGWIATTEKGIPRLKVYDGAGNLLALLSPEDLGLREEKSYLEQLRRTAASSLPCHDGWPGMPVAFDSRNRLMVSLPGVKQIRLYEILPT